MVNYQQFVARSGTALPMDIAFGVIAILLVLEATRRQTNLILPIIGAFFIIYGLWTNYFPGFFQAGGTI